MTDYKNNGRTYDWNGHTNMTITAPHLSDFEVAGAIRMLMRDQVNHEGVCTMARDRIMCLVKEKTVLEAERDAKYSFAEPFQDRVQPWLLECFGPTIAADVAERNHRFVEEALELVQSLGCTAKDAHQLVDYVFGRTVGDSSQEVGGVMMTLAALCLANDLNMHEAAETELDRVWANIDKIRAKQAAKPKHSPLPEDDVFNDVKRGTYKTIHDYYMLEIGRLMQQAEHWVENGKPLAVHDRLRTADAYYQVAAMFEPDRIDRGFGDPIERMEGALESGPAKQPGKYPPSKDLHRYWHVHFAADAFRKCATDTPDTTMDYDELRNVLTSSAEMLDGAGDHSWAREMREAVECISQLQTATKVFGDECDRLNQQVNTLTAENGRLRALARQLLDDMEEVEGAVCDCPHEPENEGRLCTACQVRTLSTPEVTDNG